MHSRSSAPNFIAAVTKLALLTMLSWVSVAPFGAPVVPEVNWMLTASPGFSDSEIRSRRSCSSRPPRAITSAKLNMPGEVSSPMRMTNFRCGSLAAFSLPGSALASSGASVSIMPR